MFHNGRPEQFKFGPEWFQQGIVESLLIAVINPLFLSILERSFPICFLQHNPVTAVNGPGDDLVDSFIIYYLPLNGLGAFEYLFVNRCVAGIDQGG